MLDLTIFVNIGVIVLPILLLTLWVKLDHLISVTNKNHNIIMATLADFQKVANDIDAATENISSYVQGTGMSAAEQDEALKLIQDKVNDLTSSIPVKTTM